MVILHQHEYVLFVVLVDFYKIQMKKEIRKWNKTLYLKADVCIYLMRIMTGVQMYVVK